MSITRGVLAQSPEPETNDKVLDNNPDRIGIWKCWFLIDWPFSRAKVISYKLSTYKRENKIPFTYTKVVKQSVKGRFTPATKSEEKLNRKREEPSVPV